MWKLLIRQLRKSRSDGFSISELLIGSVIAGMAVTGLLVLMVNLLQDNQREQASGSVEDDMRRGLDYITRDLQEAVYVYTGDQLERNRPDPLVTSPIQGLTQYLPNFGTGVRPILAFWKVENLPYDSSSSLPANCATAFSGNQLMIDECNKVKVERRTYTLVVYTQSTNASGGWQGESRIERYQLRKYSSLATLAITPGYIDPLSQSSFERWPFDASNTNLQTGALTATRETLVDFVAAPTRGQSRPTNPPQPIECPNTMTTPSALDYISSPFDGSDSNLAPDDSGTFFACVRNPRGGQSFNQDVIVYLRGNVWGKTGITDNNEPLREKSALNTLQTRVISRGVVGKAIND
jgi:hypothetical protein